MIKMCIYFVQFATKHKSKATPFDTPLRIFTLCRRRMQCRMLLACALNVLKCEQKHVWFYGCNFIVYWSSTYFDVFL